MIRPAWCDDSNLPRVWCEHCGGSQLGIFDGIPDDLYHADEVSLSSSGAKKLTNGTAEKFAWGRAHPEPPTDALLLGTAVHTLTLGVGPEIVAVEAKSWQGKEAAAAKLAAISAGKTPLLAKSHEQALAMSKRARELPEAAALLAHGRAETSLYWRDEQTGTLLRARPDWATRLPDGRPLIIDIKTAISAKASEFRYHAADLAYDVQQEWYREGALRSGLFDELPLFLFLVIEKSPPYSPALIGFDEEFAEIGRARMRRAIDLYAHCTKTGIWPGYPALTYVGPPRSLASRESEA